MGYIFLFLAVALVCAIAFAAVGSTVGRLAAEPARQIYEHDEMLEFVADSLATRHAGELSYDDVTTILRFHHDFLHEQGVARSGGDLAAGDGPLVVDADDAVGAIVERAALADVVYEPVQVEAVLDAHLAYLEAIGATTPVDEPTVE